MKIINKKKFIARIIEIITIIGTIILTPKAIVYANNLRGYKAYGGEYFLLILALIMLLCIETIIEESRGHKHGQTR